MTESSLSEMKELRKSYIDYIDKGLDSERVFAMFGLNEYRMAKIENHSQPNQQEGSRTW